MKSLEGLKNLGPASRRMLEAAGVPDEATLRRLGSVAVFRRVQEAGLKPSLVLLYALEGAIQDEHWQAVKKAHGVYLALELDALEDLLGGSRSEESS